MRILAAALLLAAAVAALAWAWGHGSEPVTAPGDYAIVVTGPGGGGIFNGTVHAQDATALSVLQAAGEAAGFEVRTRHFGAYGGRTCDGIYVESIAGRGSEGASGWVYSIWHESSRTWASPVQSAACEALSPGDRVDWHWTDAAGV